MISIIIPAYNAEKFIKRCIESIERQTFKDWEVIVVNDGSQDNTLSILNKFEKKNKKIHVFSQENKGVSEARNFGIKKASGDLITMVDADDTLPPDSLKKLYSLMSEDVDLVIGSRFEKRLCYEKIIFDDRVYSANEISNHFEEVDKYLWNPWGKLFRKAIIANNQIVYPKNVKFGEDHLFNLKYLKLMKGRLCVSSAPVYSYHIFTGGACSKFYNNYDKIQKTFWQMVFLVYGALLLAPKYNVNLYMDILLEALNISW